MHCVINGVKYRVNFSYGATEDNIWPQKNGGNPPRMEWGKQSLGGNTENKHIFTYCEIAKLEGQDEQGKNRWNAIAGSYSVRNPSDVFVKSEGRRYAFANALLQISGENKKDIRKQFWSKYFNAHNDKKQFVIAK